MKPTEKVRTGSLISSDIRATLVDESTPPERKTPKGTSAIIRFSIEARSSSSSRSSISDSSISATSSLAEDDIGLHQISLSVLPSGRTIIRSPGASLWMPSNIVIGAGVQTKVR